MAGEPDRNENRLTIADQLTWVGAMNSDRNRAKESVLQELIIALHNGDQA